MKLCFEQVEFFCLYRVSLKSFFFLFVFFFKVQTKGWIGILVNHKIHLVIWVKYLVVNELHDKLLAKVLCLESVTKSWHYEPKLGIMIFLFGCKSTKSVTFFLIFSVFKDFSKMRF